MLMKISTRKDGKWGKSILVKEDYWAVFGETKLYFTPGVKEKFKAIFSRPDASAADAKGAGQFFEMLASTTSYVDLKVPIKCRCPIAEYVAAQVYNYGVHIDNFTWCVPTCGSGYCPKKNEESPDWVY